MTAEIAILNPSAVALAADSAVTFYSSREKHKIYNTVNKLFNLNKYYPVGIMIYGGASCLDVPWETIIKMYRSDRKERGFGTIKEYGDDFFNFVTSNLQFFPEISQIRSVVYRIKKTFQTTIGNVQRTFGKISEQRQLEINDIKQIITEELNYCYNHFDKLEFDEGYKDEDANSFIEKHNNLCRDIYDEIFINWPLDEDDYNKLNKICANIILKNAVQESTSSGIVIAGFGEDEFYPSLVGYSIDGMYENKLKFYRTDDINIDNSNISVIKPYAQKDMAYTFIDGINPQYLKQIENGLFGALDIFQKRISNLKSIEKLEQKERDSLVLELTDLNREILNNFLDNFDERIKKRYREPLLESISLLPKDELGTIAESLIYLTYLKKRFSIELETVSGAIDVAVISKGDGFIWIKRKHYFEEKLNPHFFKNYFK